MSSVHSIRLFASVFSVEGIDMHKYRHTHFNTHTLRRANKHILSNTTTNSLPFALQEMVFNVAVP